MEDVKQIVIGFFKGVRCEVIDESDFVIVKNIPEKVQKFLEVAPNIEINFKNNSKGVFINFDSELYIKIKNYLKTNPSKTLLKIDFEIPSNIREKIQLKNCSVSKIEKRHENNYFSRFTILTTFRYLNKIEQVLNEIYVHEGKVVNGDLRDYNVKEGKPEDASSEHLAGDYEFAKEKVRNLIDDKVNELSVLLDEELEKEVHRIEEHFSSILGEFNLNKSRLFERVKEAEISQDKEKSEKLKELFQNNFSEKEFQKILNEKNSIIKNEKMKFSLDVENKLINTTIIYYPIFKILVELDIKFKKTLEIVYNPLTDEISNFFCDSCNVKLEEINICSNGHTCCNECFYLCSECGKRFCRNCISGICSSCGKLICKNCARSCGDCKNIFCKNCMRVSSLTGQEKCQNCVGYCPVCSKLVEKRNMVRGPSGAMVCKNCNTKKR